MYGIRINDTFLHIYANTTFSIETNSPFYLGDDVDVLPGGLLFSVKIPLSAHNAKLLQQPHLINNALRFIKGLKAEIVVDGLVMLVGTLEVVGSTDTDADVRVVMNTLADIKDQALDTFDFGVVPDANLLQHATDTVHDPDNYNYIFFPVHNPAFFKDKERFEYAPDEFQNRYVPGGLNQISVQDGSALTPHLKVEYMIRKIFESKGFTVSNNFQTSRELRWLCAYSATSAYATSLAANPPHTLFLNNLVLNQHVSKTGAGVWLKNIMRLFCAAPFVDVFDNHVYIDKLQEVIERPPAHDWTRKELKQYNIGQKTVSNGSLGFGNAAVSPLPDLTDLKTIETTTNGLIPQPELDTAGSHILKIDDGRYILRQWQEGIQSQGVYSFVRYPNRYIRFLPNDVVDINPDKTKKYESPIGKLLAAEGFNFRWGASDIKPLRPLYGMFATAQMRGRWSGENTNPDALCFYRGMRDITTNVPNAVNNTSAIPIATNDIDTPFFTHTDNLAPIKVGHDTSNPPPQYNPVLAKYSLSWGGESGLHNQFWKTTLDFIAFQRHVTKRLQLSPVDIRNFQYNQKVRIGEMEYIVKKMKIILSSQGLQATEVELVTCV